MQKAVEMEYTIPPDYQSLILSVGYYSTVGIFGGTTSRKQCRCEPPLPTCLAKIKLKKTLSVGSCLEEGVGEEGGPEELVLCNFRVVRHFLQKSTLTLYHNPLKVPTHDRADQNLQCASAQPLNKRQVKFAHNMQLHQSSAHTRVVIHTNRLSQHATRKAPPPRGANVHLLIL